MRAELLYRSEPVEIELFWPVQTDAGLLHRLSLRPPTVRDLRTCGTPVRLNRQGGLHAIEAPAAARLMAGLAGVSPATIDALRAPDFIRIIYILMNFLAGQSPETIVRAAYGLGRFFGDLGEVMGFSMPELAEAMQRASELAGAERGG